MWTDILRALTIQVEFVRGGRKLFKASTIAGYCGILTAVRKGLSVSVNYRQDEHDFGSTDNAWPIGFLVRHVMTLSNLHYDAAKTLFKNQCLWSPCYIILAGRGEACIITRGTTFVVRLENISSSSNNILIQTNIDNDRVGDEYPDFMQSQDRYHDVKEFLETTSNGVCSEDYMWNALMLKSVWDQDTVFGTVMNPSTGEMETRYNSDNRNQDRPPPHYLKLFRFAILLLALVILSSKVFIY